MTEKLLQFIWEFQYFNRSELTTTDNESIQILEAGKLNSNQGPDFTNAKIKIGNTIFAGTVELHLKTSHWKQHGHQNDSNYKNVILHVVCEHDEMEKSTIPVIELQPRISKVLLEKYNSLQSSMSFIACSNSITGVKEITWMAWKERLLAERLTRKSKIIFQFLKENNFHWEESFWWTLASNFGLKVNTQSFEAIAKSVSINILAKHKNQIHQLEALLLGQAGLLNGDFKEDYPKLLQREYCFLKTKYDLKPVHEPVHFLRMRPGNFPTIRLAQLAMLVHRSVHLFSKVLETEKLSEIRTWLSVTANDYWHYHYVLDESSSFKKKTVGKNMIDNIVINTIVPVLFAFGLYHKEERFKNKALTWLEELNAEVNSITKGFTALNIQSKSAFDSQALIELKTQYCDEKHCLRCSIGTSILKTS